jgi:hypothetical protein
VKKSLGVMIRTLNLLLLHLLIPNPLYVGDGKRQNEAQGQPTNSASWTISEYSKYFLTCIYIFNQFSQSKTAVNTKQDPLTSNTNNTDHTPSNVSNNFDGLVGVFDTFGGNVKDELAKSCNKGRLPQNRKKTQMGNIFNQATRDHNNRYIQQRPIEKNREQK